MSKFCDLNANIKHIGEVSTSRVDGSPTGAEILTSTNGVTGDVRDTLDGKFKKMDAQFNTQLDGQSEQFQDRFNTLAPIKWAAGLSVTNALQVYSHTDEQGVERSYLPNPKLIILPDGFTTGATFADDVAAGRFSESDLLTPVTHFISLTADVPRSLSSRFNDDINSKNYTSIVSAFSAVTTNQNRMNLYGQTESITKPMIIKGNGGSLSINGGGATLSCTVKELQAVKFIDFKYLKIRNITIDCNGGCNWALMLENIDYIDINRSVRLVNCAGGNGDIVVGLLTRDCPEGFASPFVSDMHGNSVSRGVMVSDKANLICNLVISPYVKNIGSMVDGDGVYCESAIPNHNGGMKIVNGYYRNCGKRFIKSAIQNVDIQNNRGSSSNAMYSFVAMYGGSANTNSNKFSCEGNVTYKFEIGNDLNEASKIASYHIYDNDIKSADSGANSYVYNISGTEFESIVAHDNTDIGAGRIIRGFDNNVGFSINLHDNTYNSLVSGSVNLSKITLNSLYINNETCNDVTNAAFVYLDNATIEYVSITNNSGDFSYGTLSGAIRPKNLYGNGSQLFPTGIAFSEYKEGKKYSYRNNNLPTSGNFDVGDLLINNLPSTGRWLEQVCITAGSHSTAVFAVSKSLS